MRLVFAFLSSVSFGLGVALASEARAQSLDAPERDEPTSKAGLSVARDEGAEGCPDTVELSEHVARLRGQSATSAPVAYHVTFSRRGSVYRAAIRMGAGGVRVLQDRGQTCASLGQATALTLALLFDSDSHELTVEEHEPQRQAPRTAPPAAAAPPRPPPPLRPPVVKLAVSVGGAGLFGVVRTAAPAALADLGVFVNRFHTSVGALWMPTQELDLGPGQLQESLLSGVARTCYAPLDGRALRVELCSGIYAGLLRVQAREYTRNDLVKRAWLALPLEISFSRAVTPVEVELGASALVPLRQSDYSIDNLGTAYESWPVGMLLSLRVVGAWVL